MKKALPYLLIGITVTAIILLIFTGSNEKKRVLNERMSFRKQDKIPYGTFVAFENLKYIFPHASISTNVVEPGYWDSLSNYDEGQVLLIVSPRFYASEFEMKKIIRFMENGNDVFISTAIVSEAVKTILNCYVSELILDDPFAVNPEIVDTLQLSLANPPFSKSYTYSFPGKRIACHFSNIDSSIATVLGNDHEGHANFIHLKAGKGNLYFHLAPAVFSNYFLLRGRNIGYYEDILSLISPQTKRLVWDEYFIKKPQYSEERRSQQKDPSKQWLRNLFAIKEFKWALLISIFTLLLYALLEMRRKQRYIPVVTKPRNDSLDFVKTIGRLYYDKGDHKNLCRKMAAYFLEHVRHRYKLPTHELNETLIKNLQYKSGVDEMEIRSIVFFIRDLDITYIISQHQLAFFHKQLESFYSKTV